MEFMRSIIIVAVLISAPAAAQGYDETRAFNAMRDRAMAQERQARPLEGLERIERDRARDAGRARHDAEVMSRSARRRD